MNFLETKGVLALSVKTLTALKEYFLAISWEKGTVIILLHVDQNMNLNHKASIIIR